ncbi:MAG: hypothetical protein ACREL5_02970 [Gemmatimonadales bacterium]
MRRTRYLLAALMVGAASTASAQAHARISATLSRQGTAIPSLVVHVSNLFDDPRWLGALNSAYVIHLHWSVQLWQSQFLFDKGRSPSEWDDFIQQVPVMDVFRYTERIAGRRDSTIEFATLDSLKAYAGADVRLAPPVLAAGKWYYTVNLSISIASEDESRSGTAGDPDRGFFQQLILGRGPRDDLPTATTVTFVVP